MGMHISVGLYSVLVYDHGAQAYTRARARTQRERDFQRKSHWSLKEKQDKENQQSELEAEEQYVSS